MMARLLLLMSVAPIVIIIPSIHAQAVAKAESPGNCQKQLKTIEGIGFTTAHDVCHKSNNPSEPQPPSK